MVSISDKLRTFLVFGSFERFRFFSEFWVVYDFCKLWAISIFFAISGSFRFLEFRAVAVFASFEWFPFLRVSGGLDFFATFG